MLIPKTSEYALRCMAQIAVLPWETSISADELHELVEVPRGYMSKVLRKMTAAGLLTAERGYGGGFKLAQPPSKISFLEILKASGFEFEQNHCVSGWGYCDARNPCPLHDVFSKLSREIFEWASKTTLADVNQSDAVLARFRNSRSVGKTGRKTTSSKT